MGAIPLCISEISEFGEATVTALTSQGQSVSSLKTFWPWDKKIGIVFLVTKTINGKVREVGFHVIC